MGLNISAADLRSILLGTELSGNESAAYRVSYAVPNSELGVTSSNNSGFSFGIIQLDIGVNDNAQSAYRQVLSEALDDAVITQITFDRLSKYNEKSRYDLDAELARTYLTDRQILNEHVFSRPQAKQVVNYYTEQDLNQRVKPKVDNFLDELQSAWGDSTVFDYFSEGYHTAIAAIVSVVNRTNSPLSQSIEHFKGNQPNELEDVKEWFDDIIVPTFGAIKSEDWTLIETGGETYRAADLRPDGPIRSTTEQFFGNSIAGKITLSAPSFVGDNDAEFTVSLGGIGQGLQYNIAYIIDVSGSMNDGQKIDDAKNAYIALTNQLTNLGIADVANFAVIPFNADSVLYSNLTAEDTIDVISALVAGGGTAFGPALTDAVAFFSSANEGQTNVAYFLSDGISGTGASDALTSFANVQAFGIGAGADLSSLNTIDSDNAVVLNSSAQLVDVLTSSNVDVTDIDRIEITLDGQLVLTINSDQLVNGPLGLQYTDTISGLDVSSSAQNLVKATVFLNSGNEGGEAELSIASALSGTSQVANGSTTDVTFGGLSTSFDTGSLKTSNVNLLANNQDNTIVSFNVGGTFSSFGGRDFFALGDYANSTVDRVIDGGSGFDIIEYIGNYVPELVNKIGNVLKIGSNTDTITNVEEVWFSDLVLNTATLSLRSRNTPPTATDDSASTIEDQSVAIDILRNDSDPDGNNLAVSSVSNGSNGSVAINGDGSVEYTPNPNFNGTDRFNYVASDGSGGSDQAQVRVTVIPVPDDPIANDDQVDLTEDSIAVIAVLSNDSDPDGYGLHVTFGGDASHGTTSLNADGTITYTPALDFSGTDSFNYRIEDGNGGTDNATVNLRVLPVNDDPIAVDDFVNVAEDSSIDIFVLRNDGDAEGDIPSILGVSSPAHGSVFLNVNKTITYTPNPDFFGTDAFEYRISDGRFGSDTAIVYVTVSSANDAPEAEDDIAAVAQDATVTVPVLINDRDGDGDQILVSSVGAAFNGEAVGNDDGTITYTPTTGYNGDDEFSYTISDGFGGESQATVFVTVLGPVAVDDHIATSEDTVARLNVLENDGNGDGASWRLSSISSASNGSAYAIGSSGLVSYRPDTNFNGADSFFYTLSNGEGETETATVRITVEPVNDDPDAVDDISGTPEDTPVTINLLGNDSDPEGDALSVTGVTKGANGTVVNNGDGTAAYTPNAHFNGSDSFTYTVADGNGGADTATVSVTVNPINDSPDAGSDSDSTDEDTPVTISLLGNDTDPDGDALSVTGTTDGSDGTVVNNGDGTVTYTPNANFNGSDSFTYTVSDGNGGSDAATVSVTLNPVNDAPDAANDNNSTDEGVPVTIGLLGNDTDPDGDALSVTGATYGTNGTVVINGDGTVTYIPSPGFAGTDSFTYTLSDGQGGTDTATVNVEVAEVVPAIVGTAADDILQGTTEGETIQGLGGDDTLLGSDGNDFLDGGDGNDFLRGDVGDDTVDGGTGNDEVFAGPGDMGGDIIRGGAGNDTIGAGQGDDQIFGGTGTDVSFGGPGNDLIDESNTDNSPNNAWAGPGEDTVQGGDGDEALGGGSEGDLISAGGGDDVIYGGQGPGADTLNGDAGNDTIFGGGGDDVIDGGADDDQLFNGGGNDTVSGGTGSDEIWGGGGNDLLMGDADADTFAFASNNGFDTIRDFSFAEMDLLNVLGLGLTSEAQALGAMSNTTQGVLLSAGGTTILFEGHEVADFSANTGWFDETVL